MKLKLLVATLFLAVLFAGQAVGLPGVKSSPSSGGGTVDDKSSRSQEYDGSNSSSDYSGTQQYRHSDNLSKADDPSTAVPEPGTIILMGMGLAGAAYIKRRRDKQKS